MLKKFRIILLLILSSVMMQSCVHDRDIISTEKAWIVSNNFCNGLMMYTVYIEDYTPVEYVPSIAAVAQNSTVHVFCPSLQAPKIKTKLISSPLTGIYFVIPFDNMDIHDISDNIDRHIASIILEYDWMEAHFMKINFPEDCTVNPDLWKIYDLDKFVERYGPLNAQGWDEVWQKWEQAKAKSGDS